MLDKEKSKNAGAVKLDDNALEQAAGGYYEIYFKDGTKKQFNADGSEYRKFHYDTGEARMYNSKHKQVDKLEGIAVEK